MDGKLDRQETNQCEGQFQADPKIEFGSESYGIAHGGHGGGDKVARGEG